MIRVTVVCFIMLFQGLLSANNPSVNYITQYKQIAVSEMHRTGIPASIKMAQALLESGAGQSTLAREANNHFGIKCGGGWNGDTFYRKDDDYKNGKLIKSCFRKFDSVMESFMAHSEFLVTQNRYGFLFEYPSTDYKSWAKGLRKAGYATDKSYADKLIDIIEKYELHQLDRENHIFDSDAILAEAEKSETARQTEKPESDVATAELPESSQSTERSRRYRLNKNASYHIVRAGETLSEIAYLYELDESSLRLRNRLPKDAEPIEGEKLNLRKKISLLNRPQFERFSDGAIAANDADFIF